MQETEKEKQDAALAAYLANQERMKRATHEAATAAALAATAAAEKAAADAATQAG